MRRTPGFTLIELCVGLLIGGILCIGMLTLLRGGLRIFHGTSEVLEALQTAQLCTEIIKEDLQYAVLSGISPEDPATGDLNPDFTPFIYSKEAEEMDGKPHPPVEVPEPIDLTKGEKFSFYRVFRNDDNLTSLPPLLEHVGEEFTPSMGFKLARVTYSLEEKQWRDHTYYIFVREVADAEGGAVGGWKEPKKRYGYLRLKHLVFILHERARKQIVPGSAIPDLENPDWWTSFQGIVNKFQDMISNFRSKFTGLGGRSDTPAPEEPKPPPPDYAYYIQFAVTGLSSKARIKDFKDFRKNLLVSTVHFDALTEKLKRENASLYWNSHAAADGYLTTGTFEF